MTKHWDLGKVKALLEKLGNPHQKCPPYIHIVGINGKTSTCMMLEQLLIKCGRLKVGTFTYPPLLDVKECIRIKGAAIRAEHFEQISREVEQSNHAHGIECSYYELLYAKTLLAFSESTLDVIVVEAAMGGAYDATITLCSSNKCLGVVVTNVTVDHVHYLGESFEGILDNLLEVLPSPQVQLITARNQPSTVWAHLKTKQVNMIQTTTTTVMPTQDFLLPAPLAIHEHNLEAALRMYDAIAPRFPVLFNRSAHRPSPGIFHSLQLPYVASTFYLGTRQVIADAAQNASSTLFAYLEREIGPFRPIHFVLGLSAKDYGVLEAFMEICLRLPRTRFSIVSFTSPAEHPWIHSFNSNTIRDFIISRGGVVTNLSDLGEVFAETGEAIAQECLVITGSPHIVRDFYKIMSA